MAETEQRIKPYLIDFYGDYKHKDNTCEELGDTHWRPIEGGALAQEVKKIGKEPFNKDECPECW